jgi:hypothetical protein
MGRLKRIVLLLACLFALPYDVGSPERAHAGGSPEISGVQREILVDVNARRLSLLENGRVIKSYPIALGTPETPTPVGEWRVVSRARNWGGGFGSRWLGLNVPWGMYGIHGTNRPQLIGQRVSHGCIRMRNRDVEDLYPYVPTGTLVHVIGHPLVSTPFGMPKRLVHGDRGSDVYIVQNHLRAAGFYQGTPNGIFGPSTEEAIIHFQRANRLPQSKQVGLEEYRLLGLEE